MAKLKPLPDCEGPKLEPFTQDFAAHNVRILDIPEGGNHGAVAKVEIDGKIYAIKLLLDRTAGRHWLERSGGCTKAEYAEASEATRQTMEMHMSPFNCEARAFARLKEVGREDMAVKVYGYVAVYPSADLQQQVLDIEARQDCPDQHFGNYMGLRGYPADGPSLGIVKEWIEHADARDHDEGNERAVEDSRTLGGRIPGMLDDLHELHRYGIVMRDVREDQWLNGVLVDLSFAWTTPHVFGPGGEGYRPPWFFLTIAADDLHEFQSQVIDSWNNWINGSRPESVVGLKRCLQRSWDCPEVYERLRPRASRQRPFLPLPEKPSDRPWPLATTLPRHNPADFDWQASAKKTERARNKKVEGKQHSGGRDHCEKKVVKRASRKAKGRKSRAK